MSYNTLRAPSLSSYEDAVKWHNATKPIRGHKNKVRPLGERRYHQRGSISMTEAGVVELKLFGKLFVEWHKDNTFVVHPPVYVSAFSIDDMSGFLPFNMRFVWNKSRLFVQMVNQGSLERTAYQLTDEALRFSVIGPRQYELHNKPVAIAYRKRRNAIPKLLAERYGAFFSWLTVVLAVDGRVREAEANEANKLIREACGLPLQDVYEYVAKHHVDWYNTNDLWQDVRVVQSLPMTKPHSRRKWFHTESCKVVDSWMAGDNPDMWVHAMYVMAYRYGYYTWGRHDAARYVLHIQNAERFATDLVSHLYLDKLYSREVMEDGSIPPRRSEEHTSELQSH